MILINPYLTWDGMLQNLSQHLIIPILLLLLPSPPPTWDPHPHPHPHPLYRIIIISSIPIAPKLMLMLVLENVSTLLKQ